MAEIALVPTSTRAYPGLGRAILAAFVSGAAGAVAALVVWLLFGAPIGQPPYEIGAAPIVMATLIPNVLGGVLYFALTRWTGAAPTIYTIIVLAVATLWTIGTSVNPDLSSLAVLLGVLHYAVAVAAILIVPRIAPAS